MFEQIKKHTKQFLLITLISLIILLIIDFLFGKLILFKMEKILINTQFYDRLIGVKHPKYHHTLRPNVTYLKATGHNGIYTFCTDNNGFKSNCNQKRKKEFKYAFIGDSFTEAGGINYEKSFTGLFETYSKIPVANLGVSSYSTKIYLSKLTELLNEGYKFKHVVIFPDISDLYDDNIRYQIDSNLIVTDKKKLAKKLSEKIINYYKEITPINKDNFPLLNYSLFVFKQTSLLKRNQTKFEKLDKNLSYTKKTNLIAKWTYSEEDSINGYNESVKKTQEEMINNMDQLYEILKKNNIKMSIVVYPWPHQLIFDSRNSKHVMMWKKFCENKCANFINTFDIFFDEIAESNLNSVINKYYFKNDPHFNELGNKLIFDQLIKYLN